MSEQEQIKALLTTHGPSGQHPARLIGENAVLEIRDGIATLSWSVDETARTHARRSKVKVDDKTGKTSGGKSRLLASVPRYRFGDMTIQMNVLLPLADGAPVYDGEQSD